MKTLYKTLIFSVAFCFIIATLQAQYLQTKLDPKTRTIQTTLPVGTLPGAADVSAKGSLIYSFPIDCSPGSAGFEPNISISYNSSVADGILGKGWNISGLSAITRTGKTFYNDSRKTGVSLDTTDRFELDSNRLVLTSGTYGVANSVYKTEIESFAKITAMSTAGQGPSYFVVETKDGSTIEYGNTTNSKIEPSGSATVFKWLINKIKDRNGNYITFTYSESNGEAVISSISYTGNENNDTPPYNIIKFRYITRTDINKAYYKGAITQSTKLLSAITVLSESSPVSKYLFEYYLEDNYISLLNKITRYGKDTINSPLNSTIIGWSYGNNPFVYNELTSQNQQSIYYLGDFNGDGISDMLVTPKKTTFTSSDLWKLFIADGNSSYFSSGQGNLNSTFKGFQIVDVDGDGQDEVYWRARETIYYNCNPHLCDGGIESVASNSEEVNNAVIEAFNPPPPQDTCWDVCYYQQEAFRLYRFTNNSLVRGDISKDITLSGADPNIQMLTADFDGDSDQDFVFLLPNKNIYTTRGIICGSFPNLNTPDKVYLTDYNGDGIKDITVIKGTTGTTCNIYQINPANCSYTTLFSSSFPTSADRVYTGDFNGDRKTDILSWKSNAWSLRYSTGTGFAVSASVPALRNVDPGYSLADNNYYIADFNGDGKDDILESNKSQSPSYLKMFYSNGLSFIPPKTNVFTKSSIDESYFQVSDMNGDGKKDLFHYDFSSASNKPYITSFYPNGIKYLVSGISNGLNHFTEIKYNRINRYVEYDQINDTIFKKGQGAVFPVYDYKGPLYVVTSIFTPSGVDTNRIRNYYSYESAWIHRQGKGFLGFKWIKYNDSNYKTSYKNFEYNPVYFLLSLKSSTYGYSKSDHLKSSVYTNSVISYGNKRILPVITNSIEYDSISGRRVTTDFTIDNNGNITSSFTSFYRINPNILDATQSTSTFYETYGNNLNIPNKVIKSISNTVYYSKLSANSPKPAFTKRQDYSYDINGKLLTHKIDSGLNKVVTTTYSSYNNFGLPASISTKGTGVETRVVYNTYDLLGRFLIKDSTGISKNVMLYDPTTGNVLKQTDISGNSVRYGYDLHGNMIYTAHAFDSVNYVTAWDSYPQTYSVYSVTKSSSKSPTVKTYYDLFGREVKSQIEGQFGNIFTEKEYNIDGTLERESYPHNSTEFVKWKTYDYDDNNMLSSLNDNTIITTFINSPNSKTIITGNNKKKQSRYDATGTVYSVINKNGSTVLDSVYYNYHSSGQPDTISTNGIDVISSYDQFGRKTSVQNPNSGTVSFEYDAFGQFKTQTDARSKTFNINYDKYGRIIEKTGPANAKTTYTYITSGNGIGNIKRIKGPNNVTKIYSYDSFGRLIQSTDSVNSTKIFTTTFEYDNSGRNTKITYPSGYSISMSYTSKGYLTSISKTNGAKIWEIQSTNALGLPVQYKLGTGNLTVNYGYNEEYGIGILESKTFNNWNQYYFTDPYGINITRRVYYNIENPVLLNEKFYYDNHDRLEHDSVFNASGVSATNLTYSGSGNILSKTGVGAYTYDNQKVNAVAGVSGNSGSISSENQFIEYTDFGMTKSITEGDYRLEYEYGPDNQRIRSVLLHNGDTIKTKYYSLNYEWEKTPSGVREIHYIYSPYGLAAIMIKQNNTEYLYFTETDHLGSIIGLLNADGTYAERFSYDAWGRRRNPTDWSYNNVPAPTLIDRGYTGHEHLDVFGLINMNGRVYDPVLGRFLGVDPVIQDPYNSQNYNGYSYCLNNPLRFIDPSGNTVRKIKKENWGKLLAQVGFADLDFLARLYGNGEEYTESDYLDNFSQEFGISGSNGGSLFQNVNAGYNYLWMLSGFGKKVETMAWLTDKGLFVLPIEGFTYDKSEKLKNDYNHCHHEYYTYFQINKEWYMEDPNSKTNKIYRLIANFHVHPWNGDKNNPPDRGFSQKQVRFSDDPGDDHDMMAYFEGIPFSVIEWDGQIQTRMYDSSKGIKYRLIAELNLTFTLNDLTNNGTQLTPIYLKYLIQE